LVFGSLQIVSQMTFDRRVNRQPGDNKSGKRYGADNSKEARSGHGSPAQFFNQRGSVHSK
jgi:hypothetical protein